MKRKVAWRKDIGRYRYVGTDSDAFGGQAIDGGVSLGQAERKRLLEMYRRSPVPAVRPREDHGWRLRLGQAMDGDTIIQHRSKAVLVLDSAVAGGLADRTLDLKRTDKGARLHLQRRPAWPAGSRGQLDPMAAWQTVERETLRPPCLTR